MKSFLAIIFVLYISNVSAAREVLKREVGRRQAPAAPTTAECTPQCDAIGPAISSCAQSAASSGNANAAGDCECSDDIAGKWTACLSCAVAHGLPAASAQQAISGLVSTCQTLQHPFAHPPTAAGGGSSGSSGSGSSAAGSGSNPSAAATGSGSASPSTITSTGKSGAAQIRTFHAVSVALSIAGVASLFLSA